MNSVKQTLRYLSAGRNLIGLSRRFYSTEVTQKPDEIKPVKTSEEFLKDLSVSLSDLPPEIMNNAIKTGAELYLTPEKLKAIESAGFNFKDNNPTHNLNQLNTDFGKGFFYQYLKNMLLLNDYDNVFRSFLQATAQFRLDGLNLVTEPRLLDYFFHNLINIRRQGYNVEFQDLKIIQDYSVIRVELYKNLKINRYANAPYSRYSFKDYKTPIGVSHVATLKGDDISYFHNDRPYILATTMHVKTPMKIQVFNQNLSKKLHGGENGEVLNYVVRFETEMNLNDFAWILPTQNKPKRLRSTKIADFNNLLRGNPYFLENFDIGGSKEERYIYMQSGEDRDNDVRKILENMMKNQNKH